MADENNSSRRAQGRRIQQPPSQRFGRQYDQDENPIPDANVRLEDAERAKSDYFFRTGRLTPGADGYGTPRNPNDVYGFRPPGQRNTQPSGGNRSAGFGVSGSLVTPDQAASMGMTKGVDGRLTAQPLNVGVSLAPSRSVREVPTATADQKSSMGVAAASQFAVRPGVGTPTSVGAVMRNGQPVWNSPQNVLSRVPDNVADKLARQREESAAASTGKITIDPRFQTPGASSVATIKPAGIAPLAATGRITDETGDRTGQTMIASGEMKPQAAPTNASPYPPKFTPPPLIAKTQLGTPAPGQPGSVVAEFSNIPTGFRPPTLAANSSSNPSAISGTGSAPGSPAPATTPYGGTYTRTEWGPGGVGFGVRSNFDKGTQVGITSEYHMEPRGMNDPTLVEAAGPAYDKSGKALSAPTGSLPAGFNPFGKDGNPVARTGPWRPTGSGQDNPIASSAAASPDNPGVSAANPAPKTAPVADQNAALKAAGFSAPSQGNSKPDGVSNLPANFNPGASVPKPDDDEEKKNAAA